MCLFSASILGTTIIYLYCKSQDLCEPREINMGAKKYDSIKYPSKESETVRGLKFGLGTIMGLGVGIVIGLGICIESALLCAFINAYINDRI